MRIRGAIVGFGLAVWLAGSGPALSQGTGASVSGAPGAAVAPIPSPLADMTGASRPLAAPVDRSEGNAAPMKGGVTSPATAAAAAPTVPPTSSETLRQSIITIDQEVLYAGTVWGQRVQKLLNDRSAAVAAENDRIYAELSADEAALTNARATLSPEEFRTRASAFDARVTTVRQERELAARELTMLAQAERDAFFSAAAPVLGEVMRDKGALVVLDPRTVLYSSTTIDVTDQASARINAEVGDGAGVVSPNTIAAAARATMEAERNGTPPSAGASPAVPASASP